jgi:hypothetical protein
VAHDRAEPSDQRASNGVLAPTPGGYISKCFRPTRTCQRIPDPSPCRFGESLASTLNSQPTMASHGRPAALTPQHRITRGPSLPFLHRANPSTELSCSGDAPAFADRSSIETTAELELDSGTASTRLAERSASERGRPIRPWSCASSSDLSSARRREVGLTRSRLKSAVNRTRA